MADPQGWMDLEDCRRIGCAVVWCCTSCYAGAEATAEAAIARYGPAKTIKALQGEARCRACGGGARVFTRGPFNAPRGGMTDGNSNFSTPGGRPAQTQTPPVPGASGV